MLILWTDGTAKRFSLRNVFNDWLPEFWDLEDEVEASRRVATMVSLLREFADKMEKADSGLMSEEELESLWGPGRYDGEYSVRRKGVVE